MYVDIVHFIHTHTNEWNIIVGNGVMVYLGTCSNGTYLLQNIQEN